MLIWLYRRDLFINDRFCWAVQRILELTEVLIYFAMYSQQNIKMYSNIFLLYFTNPKTEIPWRTILIKPIEIISVEFFPGNLKFG